MEEKNEDDSDDIAIHEDDEDGDSDDDVSLSGDDCDSDYIIKVTRHMLQ